MSTIANGAAVNNPSASSVPEDLDQTKVTEERVPAETEAQQVISEPSGNPSPPNVPSTIKLDDVVVDQTIYPREKINGAVVEQYVDAIRSGDNFPPIVLEEGTNRLIDGVHRLEAARKYREHYTLYISQHKADLRDREERPLMEPPKPSEETSCRYVKVPDNVPAMLFCYGFNKQHGLRPSVDDRRKTTRAAYESNPGIPLITLSLHLGVSRKTAKKDIEDLVKAHEQEKKDHVVRRFFAEEATEEEIATELAEKYPNGRGLSQSAVSRIVDEHQKQVAERKRPEGKKNPSQSKGKPSKKPSSSDAPDLERLYPPKAKVPTPSFVPQPSSAPQSSADTSPGSIIFPAHVDTQSDDPDLEKLKCLDINVQRSDVWAIPSKITKLPKWHTKFEYKQPGFTISSPTAANLLYHFTEPGDTVIEPMTGHVLLKKVCEEMDRKILACNVQTDRWPEGVDQARLVSVNPPSIENDPGMDSKKHLDSIQTVLNEASQRVKPATILAFLVEGATGENQALIFDYIDAVKSAGWKLKRCIQILIPEATYGPTVLFAERNNRGCLKPVARYLVIAEKEGEALPDPGETQDTPPDPPTPEPEAASEDPPKPEQG